MASHGTKERGISIEVKKQKIVSHVFHNFVVLFVLVSSSWTKKASSTSTNNEPCLTGNFVDIQNWAMHNGSLNPLINSSYGLDLSGKPDALSQLRLLMGKDFDPSHSFILYKKAESSTIQMTIKDQHEIEYEGLIALKNVYYLSLALNYLDRIPLFYIDSTGIIGSNWNHLRYLSLYGNNFHLNNQVLIENQIQYSVKLNATVWEEISPKHSFAFNPGRSNWAADLSQLDMSNLLELDLRNCSIEIIYDDTFKSLHQLRRLYLSENKIQIINVGAFSGLNKLVHLDISRNEIDEHDTKDGKLVDGMTISKMTFANLKSLKSLDMSHSTVTQTSTKVFEELGPTLERLSICYTRFPYIGKKTFAQTSLKYLDISGNIGLEQMTYEAFDGIDDTLEILIAKHLGVKSLTPFKYLSNLRVLELSQNDIHTVELNVTKELKKLRILDLSDNRITNWHELALHNQHKLELLNVDKNNLNLLSLNMLEDFNKLKFLSLGKNSFVCNCNIKSFFDHFLINIQKGTSIFYPEWYVNETIKDSPLFADVTNEEKNIAMSEDIKYHNAYLKYSRQINEVRMNSTAHEYLTQSFPSDEYEPPLDEIEFVHNFTFFLLDYSTDNYQCVDSKSNVFKSFSTVKECEIIDPDGNLLASISATTLLVILLVIISIIIMAAILLIWKWWYVRYFFMMMKNIAVLSIMGKDNYMEDSEKVFNYDVFVSYCEEDRAWVLDEFLTHIEDKSSISVCLHERDFQVGLSILENIISCMDRSRALLLVVSNQFLMSQWCQFEMHLAQHRLLETRREQLILVLLEDIPRRKRPNTLHYLMMTKTYIVWPKEVVEQAAFWKRLKRALMHGKISTERHSSA